MAVPDFQKLMLPLLKTAADGQEHAIGDVIESLAAQFGLTPDDRKDMLPSGKEGRFDNRVRWAAFYLRKAVLLESTGRGRVKVTARGRAVLNQEPTNVDIDFLTQFPEFREFRTASAPPGVSIPSGEAAGETPQELLELSHQNLRNALAEELLGRVRNCSPKFFEGLVLDLLIAMDYGGSRKDAAQAVGQSRDGGIDGLIKEDRLGLDVVYVQAKRWEGTVGRKVVAEFAGSLEAHRARKGVLITTSQFSQDAKEFVGKIERKIVLIDGDQLTRLMIDHGIGVTEVATYVVRKIDLDYFGDEQ